MREIPIFRIGRVFKYKFIIILFHLDYYYAKKGKPINS